MTLLSGSAHFINKCDNGVVVHRNRDASTGSLREAGGLWRTSTTQTWIRRTEPARLYERSL